MRREMATLAMVPAARPIPVTVSVGVAAAGPAELGVTALIERADDALYEAKRAGRDRCSVAGAPSASLAAPEPLAIGPPAIGSRSRERIVTAPIAIALLARHRRRDRGGVCGDAAGSRRAGRASRQRGEARRERRASPGKWRRAAGWPADVAHDVNDLLTAITGHTELLIAEPRPVRREPFRTPTKFNAPP